MTDFMALESLIIDRKRSWGDRDGITPEQRCAMLLAYKGLSAELLMLAPKQTLRVLFQRGLIDYRGTATAATVEMIDRWCREDEKKKRDRLREHAKQVAAERKAGAKF